MRVRVIAAMTMLGILGGCGASELPPDTADAGKHGVQTSSQTAGLDFDAWSADLEAAGYSPTDLPKLKEVTEGLCQDGPDALALFVSLQIDAQEPLDSLRINFRHVCPEQLDKLAAAEATANSSVDITAEACAMDPSARTEEQEQTAELMGC